MPGKETAAGSLPRSRTVAFNLAALVSALDDVVLEELGQSSIESDPSAVPSREGASTMAEDPALSAETHSSSADSALGSNSGYGSSRGLEDRPSTHLEQMLRSEIIDRSRQKRPRQDTAIDRQYYGSRIFGARQDRCNAERVHYNRNFECE